MNECTEEKQLRSSTFRVADRCCGECLFSPNKIVSDNRRDVIIEECLKGDTFFICHKGSLEGKNICCRAFYEKHGRDVLVVRLARMLGVVSFVPVG